MSNATDLWDDALASAKGCCKPDRKDCTALLRTLIKLHQPALHCLKLHCTALDCTALHYTDCRKRESSIKMRR